MARSRDIEYKVGFTGDTSQLEAAVKKATDSLTKLGTSPDALRKGIDGAARSALELSNHLNTAFNQNTGKLDLIKFQQSLKASGKEIQDYANSLRQLGPEGEQAFLEVASAIGKAELPLRRTNTLIKQFGQTLWNTARWRITTGAINAIVGGMQQAVGYAKSLDASLNNIRIVTGKSAEEMARFAKEANTAAKTLSTTTTTYTDASLIYYQQGLDTEAVKQRTEATIKMANVTGQAAETISSQMTAIWENFDDGSRSLESFGDSLVALGATTAASSKEIAEGLQKFAPIAQTVGLSFDYASAALTTIVANTRESASVAGTALKTLFSRLEGLKLGETLDDGTDLNKYSNALLAVGVNIKDVSGNLKDMDTILDELGTKWKTLAKDQQLALAETVGGVRQYAQLVALMDNWGDFQKNLVTAQTSEGALQRQADIYAESWEAARKRIKAATEDIYDSLINPDQFIKLDDTFTPLLSGIASAVDALGGLTGMLPLVVMLMNKAFGDKIAQSLRDMTVNIGLMTGAEQKRARALQDTVAETAKSLSIGYEENAVVDARVSILQEEVALQAQINSNIDQMPAAQQDVLNNELKIVDAYKQQAVASAELLETKKEIAENARIDIWSGASNSKGITTIEQLFGNKYQSIQNNQFIDTKSIDAVNDLDNAIASLTNQLEKAVGTSAKISHLNKALSNTKTVTEEAKNEAIKLLEAYGKAPGANASVEQIRVKLKQLSNEASTARTALRTALQNLDVDPHSINVFIGAVTKLTEAGYDSEAAIEAVRRAMEKAGQTAQASSAAFFDWADALVKIGSYASKTAMAVRAIGNLKEVFSKDSDLGFSERLTQGAMSIGMLAPLLSSGIKGFQNFKQNSNINFSKLTTEVEKSKLAFDAATQSVVNNKQAITDLSKKIGNLPKGTDPTQMQRELAALKASTQGLKDTAKQTGDEYSKLAASAKLAAGASKDAALAAGVAGIAVTALAVAIALTVKYVNDYKEKVKQLNKEKMETADKTKEEISNNQTLINSYRELLDSYRETGEGKDQLDAKARELADAFNIEGAALASLTGNYEEFLDKINQLNRVKLAEQQKTLLEGANASVSYSSKKVTFGEDAAQALSDAGLYQYVKPGTFGLTLDLEISTNSYDELLSLQKKLEAVKDDAVLGAGVTQILEEINTELTKAKDYLTDAAIIEVQLKAPDGSDISSYEGFKSWQEQALGLLKSNSNFDTQLLDTSNIIKQSALDLGLDEWVQIQNVTEDIEAQLKKYPGYLEKAKSKFGEITSLDDAKIFEYLPWSQVNDDNFEKIYEQTKAYIKAQEMGAQVALKYADAEKLLQKIQSGSKLNAKDLEDYAKLFEGGTDEFIDFLTKLSPDDQEAKLNKIMQDSFAQQQRDRANRVAEIGETGKNGLLGQSENSRDAAKESLVNQLQSRGLAGTEDQVNDVIESVTNLQESWDLTALSVRNYYSELEKAQKEGTEGTFLSENKNPLEQLGLDPENLEADLGKLEEYFTRLLNINPYTEAVNKYQLAKDEVTRLEKERNDTDDEYKIQEANYERETNLLVGQIKTLGDLNKLQKTRNLTTDQYTKGILNLAKTLPQAANKLKEYTKEVETNGKDTDKANQLMRELADLVDEDSWGQAIGKIKDANKELEAAGMKLGKAEDATDPEKYKKNLGEIANALREVTGATEDQINESWVENHAQEIQKILSGEVETVNSAVGSIRLALFASSQDFVTYAESIGIEANNIQNIVNALDGIEFDINGYADMSQVINQLHAAGATATQIAELLKYIGNAQVGFKVEGVPDLEDFVDPETGGIDMHAYQRALKNFSKTKIKATTNLTNIPPYGSTPTGGGGSNKSNFHKDQTKDLEDAEDRYHEINRELDRQERILSKIETQIDRTYGQERLDQYIEKEKELTTTLEDQKKKSKEAIDNARKDAAKLGLDLFGNISNVDTSGIQSLFTEGFFQYNNLEGIKINSDTHEIENYQELIAAIVDDYNKQTIRVQDEIAKLEESKGDAADGDKEGIQERIDALKTEQETWDKLYDDRMTGLKNYENSLDVVNTEAHDIEQTLRDIADNRLNEIEFKLQLATDVRDLRNEVNDFVKSIAESVGDNLTHSISTATADSFSAQNNAALWLKQKETWESLQAELNNATEYTDKNRIIEQMKNLQGEIIATGEELLGWLDEVENMYVDALSDASARFHEFTDQLAHNTEIVSTMKELYALQGVTYKTRNGFNELQKTAMVQYQGYLEQAQANKQWYDDASQRLTQAEAKLAMVNENSVNYDLLKKNRDALLAEQNEAQKAMLESAKNAMETIKQMQLDTVTAFQYELEQGLTNDLGFDLLQDKFDHLIEEDERYLDVVEEGLETAAWYSKLQSDIDKTRNKAYKERLTALQKEIDYRRENNTLSQYDLDILEARYQVLQAEMALEDARNNKTTLRLTRDEQGNWNYQYSADLDSIRDKEQELLKARQNEYEITKQRTKDLYTELIQMGQKYAQEDAEIRQKVIEGILTPEEGEKRLTELETYYGKKAEYLSRELGVARDDMSEAAIESQTTAAALSTSVLRTSSDSIKEIVGKLEDSGVSQYEIASSNFSDLQSLLRDHVPDFEECGDDVRKTIQDIIDGDTGEGSSLYNFSQVFDEEIGKALRRMETTFVPQMQSYSSMVGGALQGLQGKITNVAEAVDVGENSLNTAVDKASEKLTNLYTALETVIPDMWSQLDAVRESQREFSLWSDAVWETVRAMQSLAENMITPTIEEVVGEENNLPNPKAKLDIYNSSDYDFSQKMAAALYNDEYDKYEEFAEARNDAIIKGISAGKLSTNDNEKVKTRLEALYQSGDTETLRRLALGYSTISDTYGASTGASYLHEANNNQTSRILDVGEFEGNIERKIAGYYYNSQIDPNNSIWASGLDAAMETYTKQVGKEAAEEFLKRLKELSDKYIAREFAVGDISSFRSGGYTGSWSDDNGRLALLHQKELILNTDDTEKILEAVHIMRSISDTVFQGIAKSLDSAGAASMALLGSQLSGLGLPSAQATNLEQHVTIEQVNFPGVTSSREIEEAFESLVNDAAQWARRRKS